MVVAPGTQRKSQILIVAAEASFREGVTARLQNEGYTVQSAPNDQEALDLLRQDAPDLILLDADLVGSVGAARRRQLALAGTPIVAFGPAAAGGGADAYLPQPVSPEQLLSVIRRYLTRPRPIILVVEDDLSIQRMFQVALETAGFVVWQAAAGQVAIDLVRQHRESITLALLDVQLIGPLDGPQTALALRQLRPELPFCFMSGYAGSYTAEQLLALGAAHVFPKPFPSLAEVIYLLWRLVPLG